MMKMKYLVRRAVHFVFSEKVANLSRPGGPPDLSSISLYNVSCCVPILGTKNGTCLSDGPALHYGIRADFFKKNYQEMFNFKN